MIRHLARPSHRLVDPVQHQVDRRVAVGVHDNRHPPVDQLRRAGHVQLRFEHRVRAVVGRRAGRPFGVRLRQPGGAPLGRSVEQELHAGDAEPAAVIRLVDRALGLSRLQRGRECGHVGVERLAVGCGAQRRQRFRNGAAVLNRGGAVTQVHVDGTPREGIRVTRCTAERSGVDEPPRLFFEHPVGFPRPRLPPNVAAGRIGGLGRNAGVSQRRGVGRTQVSGNMGQHDPVLGRGPVQVVARRMAALRDQGVVVADPLHQSSGRDVPLGNPGPDLADDAIDVIDVADGRRMQGEQVERPPHREEVAVCVDEARQQRAVSELDHARGFAAQRHDVVQRPGRGDRLARDGHRFDPRLRRIHGDDGTTGEDRVGRGAGVGRSAASGRSGGERQGHSEAENQVYAAGHAVMVKDSQTIVKRVR